LRWNKAGSQDRKNGPAVQERDHSVSEDHPFVGEALMDNHELSDGGWIEPPDDNGEIWRRDKDGNCEEIRIPSDNDYDEWEQLFL
jgi:hypothetical protein